MIEYISDITFTPFSIVHFLVAAGLSCHVLLNKRDTNSAIGWIALGWFSPIIGVILYVLFGVNRVKRRAFRLRRRLPASKVAPNSPRTGGRDDHFAPLEAAVGRITDRAPEGGNTITAMHNGDEGYPVMLAAIDAATVSVAMSSYIFVADDAGGLFIDALIRAKQRGCEVRVIVDGIGGGYWTSRVYYRLLAADVRVERFLHSFLPWKMPFLNLRSHKKVLILDGCVAFTGGLNIADNNVLEKNPPWKVRDTHFRFEGPVVTQLMETFVRDWLFVADETLVGDEKWFPLLKEVGEANARVITSGPDQDVEKIEAVKFQAVMCARKSVRILTPYFLPDGRLETALAMVAMRGVEVDIVIPQKSDHAIMDWAKGAQLGPLIAAGCRVWSNPPPFEHSKLLAIDAKWCLIGSANWDMRSLRLNFELDVEVYHSDLTETIEAIIESRKVSQITAEQLRARPLPARVRDSAARLLLPYL